MVCDISRELFEFQDNIDFMGYLLQEIDHKSHIEDIDEFSNIEEENEFAHFSDLLQVFNCIRTKESLSREEEIIKE